MVKPSCFPTAQDDDDASMIPDSYETHEVKWWPLLINNCEYKIILYNWYFSKWDLEIGMCIRVVKQYYRLSHLPIILYHVYVYL